MPLLAEWHSYDAEIIPAAAGVGQREECRRAFYAGACAMWTLIFASLDEPDDGQAALKALRAERRDAEGPADCLMPPRSCCSACGSPRLMFVREHWDQAAVVFVGTVLCIDCHASLLYQRRADEPLPETTKGRPMAKRPSKTDRKLTKPDTPTRGRPRQQELIADRRIKPLDDSAAAYVDLRDRRMELTREEHELKETTKKLMKKYDKTIYRHDGIEIRIVPGEDDVKVKVQKPGEPAADDENSGDQVDVGEADAEA